MKSYCNTLKDLSGYSCRGFTSENCSTLILEHCPEFYQNPKKYFIQLIDSLPNQQEAWSIAFIKVFISSSFVGGQLQHLGGAVAVWLWCWITTNYKWCWYKF